MTCIVAVVERGTVYLGGDSAATAGQSMLLAAGGKLVRTGAYLIGSTGSFRLIQLLLHQFVPPPPPAAPADLAAFMTGPFVDSLRDCLRDAGFARHVNGQEGAGLSELLVAVAGRLFLVFGDFGVVEPDEPWAAVGSGDQAALGSLYSTQALPPRLRVYRALEAAERYTANVRRPFVEMELPAAGSQEEKIAA